MPSRRRDPAAHAADPAEIREMFDAISRRYDLLNRLITFGQDVRWRRMVADLAQVPAAGRVLDLGAGTGDVARELAERAARPALVVAADFSARMLAQGRTRGAPAALCWCVCDALRLPFRDAAFDAVTSAYLARNVADVARMFEEMARVVRPGGRVVCLDTTPPPGGLTGALVRAHLRGVIPALGWLLGGRASAYRYLPRSTESFLAPRDVATLMERAGLREVQYRKLMLGSQAVHVGVR